MYGEELQQGEAEAYSNQVEESSHNEDIDWNFHIIIITYYSLASFQSKQSFTPGCVFFPSLYNDFGLKLIGVGERGGGVVII